MNGETAIDGATPSRGRLFKRLVSGVICIGDAAAADAMRTSGGVADLAFRLNSAIVIAAITLLIGFAFDEGLLWIPASILVAAGVDLLTRGWYSSNVVGEWEKLSIILKFIFAFIGFYATIGQAVCVGLLCWWLTT